MEADQNRLMMYRTLRYGYLLYFIIPVAVVFALANCGLFESLLNEAAR